MYAARGEVCIDAGPSPSLLSSVQNTSVSGNRIECGDVSLASQCRRTFPCDTLLVSFFLFRPGEGWQLRRCATKESLWHRSHQGAQNAQNVRTCHSATWNLSADLVLESMSAHLQTSIASSNSWRFTNSIPQHLEIHCQRQLRSLNVSHQHYTLQRTPRRRELPIIGFNIEIYHHYDAEVGGPLKGPSNDTSKKRRCCSIETSSSEKLQNVSVLSQSSRLVSLQDTTTEDPATIPYSHHVATERVEEFTPFCAAASSK